MRPLLALLIGLMFAPVPCSAQASLPTVTDGLVAWFSFDSTYCDDISGLCFTPNLDVGFLSGDSFTAVELNGGFLEQPPREDLNLVEFSILMRCKAFPSNHIRFWKGSPDYPDNVNFYLLAGQGLSNSAYSGRQFDASPQCDEILDLNTNDNEGYFDPMSITDEWIEILITRTNTGVVSFHNGMTSDSYQGMGICTEIAPTRLGRWWDGDPAPSAGLVDHLGIWNRALNQDEIALLFSHGCTDPEACNFDVTAQIEDGSCIDCAWVSQFCGNGTIWDSTLHECVTDSSHIVAPCGAGTIWDPVNEECIVAIPADITLDGCVSVADLLVLLTYHGTCPPVPEWPDAPGLEDCLALVEHHLSVNCMDFTPPEGASFVNEGCAGTWVNASCDTAWHLVDNHPPVLDSDYVPFLDAPCSEIGTEAQALDPNILTPPFSDDCSGDLTWTVEAFPMSGGCIHSWTREWTATDACGNVSEVMPQLVMILDDEPPVVMAPPDTTLTLPIECGMQVLPSLAGFANAYDACLDGAESIFGEDSSVMDNLGYSDVISPDPCAPGEAPTTLTITRTWTTVDQCFNPGQAVQTITIEAP